MVLVNERREILGTPFLCFFMDVGLRTVLLKGPIIPKYVIAIFEDDWKHLLNDRAKGEKARLHECVLL